MTALKGRLGIDGARIPQTDRHGVVWFGRGNLSVDAGTLRFVTAGGADLEAGDYAIPFQMVSCFVLEPGTTVTHDVVRLCTAHGTGLAFVGEGGVRFYAAMPFGPDASARARRQARLWADPAMRIRVARRLYAFRLGEIFPDADIEVLRGMEGARAKRTYELVAQEYGISWRGRRYDREDPLSADTPNQALNHAATAVLATAQLATAISGAIPQLGFIHEDSGIAFSLDIADMFRDAITLPIAFAAAKAHLAQKRTGGTTLETLCRKHAGKTLQREHVVTKMIDKIKELLDGDDSGGDPKRP